MKCGMDRHPPIRQAQGLLTHKSDSADLLLKGMPWHIYILLCDQKTYYVGLTSNLNQRFESHKLKRNLATKKFSEVKLVYSEDFETRNEAELREKQLKGWSVAKKNALINGDKDLLIKLSKSRGLSNRGV